jgi:murein DD-endopeptidase MepM/ murein hydrolase activator NlpD
VTYIARISLLLVLLTGGGLLTHAQTAADIQAKINTHNEQIRTLQAQILEYEKQVGALGKQKETLQSEIDILTLSQKRLGAEISVTNTKIDSASLELSQLGIAIGDKEETIVNDQAAIAKALRDMAQGETRSIVTEVLSSGTFADAWQRAADVSQFSRALSEHIEELRVVREELTTNREAVASTKAKLEALQKQLSLQKKSVDVSKTAQQRLLTTTKNQESTYQKLLTEKRAEESAFEAALFNLASELEYILDPSKIPATGKGVLRSPLANPYVTQQFGRTSSSVRLYASGSHDGTDFRAPIGTPVFASLSGVVLEVNQGAAPNCQYGKWVLIRHNNGLATLYAHLSEISVAKNDIVVTGEVIGFSGNTGYATGPHLHYGVYLADAVSFRQYTCKTGLSVTIPIAPLQAYLNPLAYL